MCIVSVYIVTLEWHETSTNAYFLCIQNMIAWLMALTSMDYCLCVLIFSISIRIWCHFLYPLYFLYQWYSACIQWYIELSWHTCSIYPLSCDRSLNSGIYCVLYTILDTLLSIDMPTHTWYRSTVTEQLWHANIYNKYTHGFLFGCFCGSWRFVWCLDLFFWEVFWPLGQTYDICPRPDHQYPLSLKWFNFNPSVDHMPSTLWDEITYPFLNFNGATVEV